MKKLLNFRLTLFIAAALCLGIVFVYCILCDFLVASIFVATLFLAGVILYLFVFTDKKEKKRALAFSLVFIVTFLFGSSLCFVKVNHYKNADLGNHYYSVSGKITEVNVTDYGNKYIISDVEIDGNISGKLYYKVEVYVYGGAEYELGDYIAFKSHLVDKPIFYDGRFSSYAIEDGVKYSARVDCSDVSLIKSAPDIFQRANLLIKKNLKLGLSEDSFAVAYALLTGNSDYIDLDTLTSYRQAGVAHIFAVSGLHIGFVATVMNFVLKKLKRCGFLKAIITTFVLLFYSGICGFSASSVRATVMCAVMSFITVSGQKYDGISSWSIAGIVVLIISPIELFCAGFQLSFVVVAGILILQKPLARLLKFLPKKFADSLSTVLAAQIFGAPACLLIFGETSFVAIILNLIFIPVVSVIFTATLCAALISAIFGLHGVMFFPLEYVYKIINFLITFFDYDAFMIGGFLVGVFAVFCYLAVIVGSGIVNLKRLAKTLSCVAFSLVFVVGSVFYNLEINSRTYAIFSGSESISFTVVDSPECAVMIVSSVDGYYQTSRLKRVATNFGIKRIDKLVLSSGCDVDILSFVGNMRTAFELDNVIYYGEKDDALETVFLKSYPDYTINNAFDEVVYSGENLFVEYSFNGKVVTAVVGDKKIGAFSDFENDEMKYLNLPTDYYLAIFSANGDVISNAVKPQLALSYRANGWLNNAESGGNIRLLIE